MEYHYVNDHELLNMILQRLDRIVELIGAYEKQEALERQRRSDSGVCAQINSHQLGNT